jgi:DNA polymerase-3 subunit epsilon
MQKIYEELTRAFRKNSGVLSFKSYNGIISEYTTLSIDIDTTFLLLQASGYPIAKTENGYLLKTYNRAYQKQKFCIIDIETNGSKPETSQIIEIGAVMVRSGRIIDKFESFVSCSFIPKYVTKITGIELKNVIDAPSRREVLTKLRLFMEDAIFVAHNATFDYGFLNHSLKYFGLGTIGNPKLCSIDLAKRTIKSEKYGLAHLNEFLNLGINTHHRAYSDALTTARLLNIIFKNLPPYVKTTDELLRFSISNLGNGMKNGMKK